MPDFDIEIRAVEQTWNETYDQEQWTIDFRFSLKGDDYLGSYDYCAGNEYESERTLVVMLDGVDQYPEGPRWTEDRAELVPFTGTYLARVVDEDWWHEVFVDAVLAPIWEARDRATAAAVKASAGSVVTFVADPA